MGGDPLYVFPSTLYSLNQLSGSAGIVWSPSKLEHQSLEYVARRALMEHLGSVVACSEVTN